MISSSLLHKWLSCNFQEILEISLIGLSALAHFLDARQNIWARILTFPILLLNIYVYSIKRLSGKVIHSLISIFINGYAYINWKGSNYRTPIKVTITPPKLLWYMILLAIIATAICSFIRCIDSQMSLLSIYFDTLYCILGLLEKWMMSHKKLERWTLAFFRYIGFSIACYYAGSKLLSLFQLSLASIAIYGQIKWLKAYRKQAAFDNASTLSTFSQLKS
ncbi:MAG: nicotinamide mononucleotide transporter family protein [Amoebophilaceae bacterium]|nr:nicotinamide mononucleotide transporter family protein [Amoebophilaceae bacterium]